MPEICLVGTGGMMPLKDRWLTSCYIEYNGKAVLIDCGEGTQIALAQAELKISRIDMLLITHCHADHVSGLPGFLLSLGNSSRTAPLDIYLPEGKPKLIENHLSVCGKLPFALKFHELSLSGEQSFTADKIDPLLEIRSLPLRHSVGCLGYSLTLRKKQEFLPEEAKRLEIPLKYWKTLHSGEPAILDDGRVIRPEQVTKADRPPVKITYTTDSLPFNEIAKFAESSDLFICEGMYGDNEMRESMKQKRHMLMQDACRLAKKAKAKRLWLTHYSPALKKPQIYSESLSKLFEKVTISRDGEKIKL